MLKFETINTKMGCRKGDVERQNRLCTPGKLVFYKGNRFDHSLPFLLLSCVSAALTTKRYV